jgi:hypothetical protein
MARELSFQLYNYYVTRTATHIEAVITWVVYQHSLRVRVLNKVDDEDQSPAQDSQGTNTPNTESSPTHSQSAEIAMADSQSNATTTTTTAVATDDGNGKSKDKTDTPKATPKKDMNVVGRLQSLVTSDLASITLGREWLNCIVNTTLKLALGSWFLYTVLGWAAWVGLATMILLLPVPALAGRIMNTVQVCHRLAPLSCDSRVLFRNAKWRLRMNGCHI